MRKSILPRPLEKKSLPDLAYDKIRADIVAGRWKGALPGTRSLAVELEVSRATVVLAVKRLEGEGMLRSKGSHGRKQPVHLGVSRSKRPLEIGILLRCPLESLTPEARLFLLPLLRDLEIDGHRCNLLALPAYPTGRNDGRLIRWMERQQVDVFLPYEFPENLLTWLAAQSRPVFALAGGTNNLRIAGTGMDYAPALRNAVGEMIRLGHTRIVAIIPEWIRCTPNSRTTTVLREELGRVGIKVGSYHIPEWTETREGLRTLLESLFRVSPPTAIITRSTLVMCGVITFLMGRGLRIPFDVSLMAESLDESVAWLYPEGEICHGIPDGTMMTHYCRQWVRNVARHRISEKFHLILSPLFYGTSIGPPKT